MPPVSADILHTDGLHTDSFHAAVAALVHQAGATLLATRPLAGGVSAQMSALEVRLPNGDHARWMLRRPAAHTLAANPHALRVDVAVLRQVAGAGLPVPTARLLDESGAHLPGPALVLDYIEGAPCFDPGQGDRVADALAALLARLHRAALPGPPGLPAYALPPARATLDHSLGEGAIRAALAATWPPPPTLPAAILLHGDAWPGNLLWHDDRAVALLDWEDAVLGDPLADLAVSRLDMAWLFGFDAMQRLTATYAAATGYDLASLPMWDLAAALRPCGNLADWAAGWPALGRADLTLAAMAAGHARFVAQALSLL
jgi:aminoglycoside phosphotransferase (APT) family kinase protein